MNPQEIFSPHHGRTVKFGRTRAVAHGPRMKMRKYLQAIPPAPPAEDYSPLAAASLSQIFGNDQLGDCVIAGIGGHILGVETGNAGACFVTTEADIIKEYSAIGGYVVGDASTDQGCNEETALNWYVANGTANGTKPLGWLAVDATNENEVKSALYLFENLVFGIELPDAWVTPFPDAPGFVWDVAGAPDPQNGHCIVGVGYTAAGVIVASWGMLGVLTWAAIAEYCCSGNGGELYVLITPDQLTKGQQKAPNGFAWADLIVDFDALGGHVSPPDPIPVPAPVPQPASGPVTLAQAQAFATAGLARAHAVLTRGQAEAWARKGLSDNWPK